MKDRVDSLDWAALTPDVDAAGSAQTGPVLGSEECREISALYDDAGRFRATIDMARYRFGSGQYRYFDHPLPPVVAELRAAFYPHLLPIARGMGGSAGSRSAVARHARRVAGDVRGGGAGQADADPAPLPRG